MNKDTCIKCQSKCYGYICDECFNLFEWDEHSSKIERATYDPQDDKLRLYSGKVSDLLFAALSHVGFARAYTQGCFYAVWSPTREDVALELCDEIIDEDTTLSERAEARSLRFATYSGNAGNRMKEAMNGINKISQFIEFGQPILVGHHSERRARRDIERMERLSDKMVEELDRKGYWSDRARAVQSNVEFKLDRCATIRRIKRLEVERRKHQSIIDKCKTIIKIWSKENMSLEDAIAISGTIDHALFVFSDSDHQTYSGRVPLYVLLKDGLVSAEEAQKRRLAGNQYEIARQTRYTDHLDGQIEYWKTFLIETHGEDIDKQRDIKKGQWIMSSYFGDVFFALVTRVNKSKDKRINTVTVDLSNVKPLTRLWCDRIKYENICEVYDAEPTDEDVLKIAREFLDKKIKWVNDEQAKREENAEMVDSVVTIAESVKNTELKVNHNADFVRTPRHIIMSMISLADIRPSDHCLEPEAGDGRISEAMRFQGPASVDVCEIDHNAICHLAPKYRCAVDFLSVGKDDFPYPITKIIMNPPFSKEQDIIHIAHAYEILAYGGTLVAIVSEHGFFSNSRRSKAFMEFLRQTKAHVESLPDDTFSEDGVFVKSRLLVIQKEKGSLPVFVPELFEKKNNTKGKI